MKISIVTGGGSGIGLAVCKALAADGHKVIVVDLSASASEEVAQEILSEGGDAHAIALDVSDHKQVKHAFEQVAQQYGSIDVLVNNAGIGSIGTLEETTESELDKVYQVNVKGVYNCAFATISQMKKQQSGVIVNMASIASSVGIPDRFAYSMSKGAVLTMTYSIAKDYVEEGIRCNCVAPARVHTPFVDNYLEKNYPENKQEMFQKLSKTQPIGRMAKPVEIAQLVKYLCSDDASFITGSNFPIDGGFVTINN
ncbi:SDR family oxidoreductase [Aliiglaciecola sp. 2_MG-2023]|uniref:SDR family NAD(P)-dependent oxidoreductase n=1 Tax=unclassified Aliiglaciecola TaxID=2593648 RepID=UPI0026E11877|nr:MULTISPECIES: SDR family oxidoreductase [unclassified Aliiglaciecola]MDO6711030.1 SDR family oxidoreductase [Aliiglaciecola sp. 2_MG-2023]MDO6754240.1 SDR family oxidoreductase [Aliiglaciecola sp. 1_MG-2023]